METEKNIDVGYPLYVGVPLLLASVIASEPTSFKLELNATSLEGKGYIITKDSQSLVLGTLKPEGQGLFGPFTPKYSRLL